MSSSHDHGPLTPDPARRRPDHLPDPQAGEDDSEFALPDSADLQDFGLSDPGRLSGVNLAAGSGSGSADDWLPPLPSDELGEAGGSRAEFDLPPLGDSGESSLFGGEDAPAAPALHVEPAFESEEVPFAEILPAIEPDSPEELAAEAGSSDGGSDLDLLGPVAPGAGWFDSQAEPGPRSDEADLGGELPLADDSSNILGRLASPVDRRRGDSSAVRLEAPGGEGTLADEPPLGGPAARLKDPTDSEFPLPAGFDPAAPAFAAGPTAPEFDLGSDARADDILAAAGDQPYLPGGTSSIFTGLPAVTGSTDAAAAAAFADADAADAVEFTDYPAARPADSDRHDVPTALAAPVPAKPRPGARTPTPDPSMVVDWVDESRERPAVPAAAAAPAKSTREPRDRDPVRRPPEPGPVNRGAVGGMFLGLLLGGGVVAGLNYAGIWDLKPAAQNQNPGQKQQVAANPPANGGQPAQVQPVVDGRAALAAGDPAGAVKAFEKGGATTPADKAALGEARVLAWLRGPADAPGLKQAQDDLKAAAEAKAPGDDPAAARAALYLGLTHELAGDRAEARKVYEKGRKDFAGSARLFETALDRLNATDPNAGKSSRLAPAEVEGLMVLAAFALVADPPADEPAEAGPLFWKAVNAANAGKYDEAVKLIGEAKAAHEKRAKALAGRGLNPLSDPLEQIFPRSCDDLKAYWELRRTIYDHPAAGAVAKKEGVAKALDQLAAAEKKAAEQVKDYEAVKAAGKKLADDLKAAGEKVTAAEKELKAAGEKVASAEQQAKTAGEKMAAAEKEAKAAKDLATKYRDDIEAGKVAAQKELDKRAADLKAAEAEQKKATDALAAARVEGKKAGDTLDAVAKALREAKLLDDKADPAAVLAATRAAAKAAGGPDSLKAELKELAGRAAKAEELAKTAADKLTEAEAKFKADAAKLRDDGRKAVADLREKQAAQLTKLTDEQRETVTKLQKEHGAEVKKMADSVGDKERAVRDEMDKKIAKLQETYLASAKEQGEKFSATEKKIRESAAADVKKVQDALEEERKKLLDKFTADAKKLKDEADAAKDKLADAQAAAKKAGEAEAAAKKEATALAERAKTATDAVAAEKLRTAEATRAMEAEKARAEELRKLLAAAPAPGVGVVTPGAAPPRDAVLLAARSLDAGITAYKAGRFEEAERSLAAATTTNPADPVGWYFLGAARWGLNRADAAREAFRRGSEAESARGVPARVVDAAVGPIQGPARDALSAARP